MAIYSLGSVSGNEMCKRYTHCLFQCASILMPSFLVYCFLTKDLTFQLRLGILVQSDNQPFLLQTPLLPTSPFFYSVLSLTSHYLLYLSIPCILWQ